LQGNTIGSYANRQRLPTDQRSIFQAKADACVTLSGSAAQTCYEDIQNTAYLSATDIFLAQELSTDFYRAEVRGFYGYWNQPYFYALSKGPIPSVETVVAGIHQSVHFTGNLGATVTLSLPLGSVTQTMQIVVVPDTVAINAPGGFHFGNLAFNLQAYVSNALVPSHTFASPLTLTLHYNNATRGPLVEDELILFWWDGNAWVDAACGPYERDVVNDILRVPICHFSEFALGGITNDIYLPLVLRSYP
jgi:hypothetical protein